MTIKIRISNKFIKYVKCAYISQWQNKLKKEKENWGRKLKQKIKLKFTENY